MQKCKPRILVECSLLIALGTILSCCPIFQMPHGGTITLFGTMPILIASFRNGTRWGLLTGFVHGFIQMLMGIKNILFCTSLLSQIACILLDYILAFSLLGIAALFPQLFGRGAIGMVVGSSIAGLLRLGCSFLSGILLWGGYAPPDAPVWLHSLIYNGSYIIPEMILSVMATMAVMRAIVSHSGKMPTSI